MLYPFLKTNTLLLSFKARNMTMRDINSKVNLEIENLIICHSVEEGEENKKSKLFFLFLCM